MVNCSSLHLVFRFQLGLYFCLSAFDNDIFQKKIQFILVIFIILVPIGITESSFGIYYYSILELGILGFTYFLVCVTE